MARKNIEQQLNEWICDRSSIACILFFVVWMNGTLNGCGGTHRLTIGLINSCGSFHPVDYASRYLWLGLISMGNPNNCHLETFAYYVQTFAYYICNNNHGRCILNHYYYSPRNRTTNPMSRPDYLCCLLVCFYIACRTIEDNIWMGLGLGHIHSLTLCVHTIHPHALSIA